MKFKLEDDYGLFDAGRKYEKYLAPSAKMRQPHDLQRLRKVR